MVVPEEIIIGPFVCKVKIAGDSLTKDAVYGYFDHSNLEIKIGSPELPPAIILDTLLHESLHGLFRLSGELLPQEHEEQLIAFLTPHLMLLFKDNPELMGLMTAFCQGTLEEEENDANHDDE